MFDYMKLIFKLLFIAFSATNVLAEDSFLFEPEANANELYKQLEDKSLLSTDWSIHRHFKIAFGDFLKEDYAKLSESLEDLKYLASTRGYTDLPDYSMELLRNAAVQKEVFNARYLIDKAVYLSPTDSRVAFTAASFYRTIGMGKALKLFFGGLAKVRYQPLLLASIILNLLIVVLVASTISVFFVYFIQMLRNSNNIRELFASRLHWKNRGFASIVAFLVVSIAPLYLGILVVLLVWGVCLAFAVNKRYLFAVGFLCIAWGWLLPKISTVAFNLNDPSSKVFEDLNMSRYSPKSEKYLEDRLNEVPNDGSALFFLGQTFRLKGFTDSAVDFFSRIENLANIDLELRKVAKANLGVVAFDSGNYSEALELLKQSEISGIKGFEIFYNLAITNLLLLDTNEYNRYYKMARDIDPARTSEIVAEKYISPKAILIPISSSAMIRPLFKKIASTDTKELSDVQIKYNKVANTLAGNLKFEILVFIGLAVIVFAYNMKTKKMHAQVSSPIWVFFPFGGFVTGNHPIVAIIGLTMLFCLLLISPTGLLINYANFSSFEAIYNQMLYVTLLLMFIYQVLHYCLIRGDVNAR